MGETRISSLYYILGWIIMNVTMGAFQSVTETAGIAWWGHIGGFIAGVVFAEAYKNLKPG
jgi:membrane associated rhomboid family serine protease